MAKSMLHAVVGMLVAEGRLGLDAPAPVPEWREPGDRRSAITLQHLLEMRDGVWDGERLLPEGWVDHARLPRSVDPVDGRLYGAQWWVTGDRHGSFWANGYEGQSILVCPGQDLVVVRLGKSTVEQYPALARWRAAVVDAFAPA